MDTLISTHTDKVSCFFDDLIKMLKKHKDEMNIGIIDKDLGNYYQNLISGNLDEAVKIAHSQSVMYFIEKITRDYIKEIGNNLPMFLAFDFTNNKVLVWAIIKDDDEAMERFLFLTEAKINHKYRETGFELDTTIMESCDRIAIPSHYKIYHDGKI